MSHGDRLMEMHPTLAVKAHGLGDPEAPHPVCMLHNELLQAFTLHASVLSSMHSTGSGRSSLEVLPERESLRYTHVHDKNCGCPLSVK